MQVRTSSAIGAAIRSRRRELKLDQNGLARKIGATRQWVIAIEKGKDTAELGMVLRALAALDFELDLRPTRIASPVSLAVEPLPVVDIDAIADSARAFRIAGAVKQKPRAGIKARKARKTRQGRRRA